MHHWGYDYWGMHAFWWIFWVALVALLMFGLPRWRARNDTAVRTLRRRYAQGEIDEAEFQRRMDFLTGRGAATKPDEHAGAHR